MQIKLSYLGGGDVYYWKLMGIIEDLRGRNWEYKEIADYLNSLGYSSRRGKTFKSNLVERSYKKYLIKLEKERLQSISVNIK